MSAELQAKIDQLVVDVTESEAGQDSAITFINGVNGIIAQLRADLVRLAATPEQLAVIADAGVRLDAKKDALAAALLANP